MEITGAIVIVLFFIPVLVADLKLKDSKWKTIALIAYFIIFYLVQQSILENMNKINQLLSLYIMVSCFSLLGNIELFLKYDKSVKALQEIVKSNLGLFTAILIITIYAYSMNVF